MGFRDRELLNNTETLFEKLSVGASACLSACLSLYTVSLFSGLHLYRATFRNDYVYMLSMSGKIPVNYGILTNKLNNCLKNVNTGNCLLGAVNYMIIFYNYEKLECFPPW